LPVVASHKRTVRSKLTDAMSLPSEETVTPTTGPPCRIRIVPSRARAPKGSGSPYKSTVGREVGSPAWAVDGNTSPIPTSQDSARADMAESPHAVTGCGPVSRPGHGAARRSPAGATDGD